MFCPVCNGFQYLHVRCSSCDSAIIDCGRTSDLSSPYAPYEQIVDEPLITSMLLQNSLSCKHLVYCPACKHTAEVSVKET